MIRGYFTLPTTPDIQRDRLNAINHKEDNFDLSLRLQNELYYSDYPKKRNSNNITQ